MHVKYSAVSSPLSLVHSTLWREADFPLRSNSSCAHFTTYPPYTGGWTGQAKDLGTICFQSTPGQNFLPFAVIHLSRAISYRLLLTCHLERLKMPWLQKYISVCGAFDIKLMCNIKELLCNMHKHLGIRGSIKCTHVQSYVSTRVELNVSLTLAMYI